MVLFAARRWLLMHQKNLEQITLKSWLASASHLRTADLAACGHGLTPRNLGKSEQNLMQYFVPAKSSLDLTFPEYL